MDRRRIVPLAAATLAALTIGCGGGGPASPSGTRGPEPGAIPVLAHYVTWHQSGDPGWYVSPTLPQRTDNTVVGYSSRNPTILAAHNREMLENGIVPVCSWWEKSTYAGDGFLDVYLPIGGPQLGILYEAVGPGRLAPDPMYTVDFTDEAVRTMFVRDMEHLRDKYFNGPYGHRFFRVNGKPLVFIWISNQFRGPFDTVSAGVREYIYLVGSEFHMPAYIPKDHASVVRGFDAITAYGFYDTDRFPSEMNDAFLASYTAAIRQWREVLAAEAPGTMFIPPLTFAYDERNIPGRFGFWFTSSEPTARRYAELVRGYVDTPGIPPMVWCTSYNEWYEGSAIEPSVDLSRPDYLKIIRTVFSGADS